jgi:hypothetical protein
MRTGTYRQKVYWRLLAKQVISLYGMDEELICMVNARLAAEQSYKRILNAIKAHGE